MNIREIVQDWLKEHGYGGLYCEGSECGCPIDNLMDCGGPMNTWPSITDCHPGYKRPYNPAIDPEEFEDAEYVICADKPKEKPDD